MYNDIVDQVYSMAKDGVEWILEQNFHRSKTYQKTVRKGGFAYLMHFGLDSLSTKPVFCFANPANAFTFALLLVTEANGKS
ncbi:hypothetical protein WBG78_21280 [Chryseolinea sp. T2]|uniref:hypothetical protein n=1 Tax=Chryseolinea sp. T2 TaxID=3129255 RepID=UPI0030775FF4